MKWERARLGEFIAVKHGYAFKGEFFTDSGDHVLLTPGNCYESGGLKLRGDKEKFYSGEFPDEYLLHQGDMLIVMTDLVGTAPVLGGAFLIPDDGRYLHNQRLGLVTVTDESRLEKGYLYWLLNSHDYRGQVRGSASGATVRHTSPGRVKNVAVRLPSDLDYQREVAQSLFAYDDLIDNNRRRIKLLEDSVRLLFDEWFVKGHKAGWPTSTLQQLCADEAGIQTGPFGSQLHQSDYAEEGVPVVMPKDLATMKIDTQSIARIPEHLADELGRHRMQYGDIVFGRRGEIGRRAYIGRRQIGYFCGTGCLRLRPSAERVNPRFLFEALRAPAVAGDIASRAKGSTMANLSAGAMQAVTVPVPPRQLQDRFAAFVEDASEQVDTLDEQSRKLRTARDLLLPRLMSGELTV